MPQQRRPRQADVAARAGVSPALVSLVINERVNGNVRISAETQARVWRAVRELGYVPNPVARSLAGGRNRLLGVFTFEAIFPLQQQNFYYPFLVGIEEEAEAQGYDLLLFTRAGGGDGKRAIYGGNVNRLQLADGAILLGVAERREELTRLLREGFPFVCVGRREAPGGEVSYVAADYAAATARIVEHLIALGHRRVAYLRSSRDTESSQDREAGYRLAHRRGGSPLDEGLIWRQGARRITPDLLRGALRERTTAFIAEDTAAGWELLAAAGTLGKEAPRDFSLAVLGDPLQETAALPDVTTFLIPRREMGARAVRLLIDSLANPAAPGPRQVTLPCAFVPGRTAGPPPRGEAGEGPMGG